MGVEGGDTGCNLKMGLRVEWGEGEKLVVGFVIGRN